MESRSRARYTALEVEKSLLLGVDPGEKVGVLSQIALARFPSVSKNRMVQHAALISYDASALWSFAKNAKERGTSRFPARDTSSALPVPLSGTDGSCGALTGVRVASAAWSLLMSYSAGMHCGRQRR
jgi:hypothetical protein